MYVRRVVRDINFTLFDVQVLKTELHACGLCESLERKWTHKGWIFGRDCLAFIKREAVYSLIIGAHLSASQLY